MNYFQHNIGDYAQATMHLSLIEDAIYSRLLRRYYAEEKPIINDLNQVCRWVGARLDEERTAVENVLNEFFVLDAENNVWRNKRADTEIASFHAKIEQAAEAGKKSAEARKRQRSLSDGSTVVKRKASDRSSIEQQESNDRSTPVQRPFNENLTDAQLTKNQEPITNIKEKTNKKENSTGSDPADSPCVVSDFSDFAESPPEPAESPQPDNPVSTAGAIATYCRSQGIDGNPGPRLKQLVEQGAEMAHFVEAIPIAKQAGKGFSYLLGIVKNMLTDPPRARASPANSSVSGKFDPVAYVNQGRIQHDPSIIDI